MSKRKSLLIAFALALLFSFTVEVLHRNSLDAPAYAASSDVLSAKASLNKLSGWIGGAFDSAGDVPVVIDFAHHKVHNGDTFTCNLSNATTNIGEMTVIAFSTPNTTEWTHLTVDVSATHAATFGIYETTSIDDNEGTDLTVYNRDRNSSGTSTLYTCDTGGAIVIGKVSLFLETAAATANITKTTAIHVEQIGQAGNPINVKGGNSRGTREFVLKQNTQYAVILTDGTVDDSTSNIVLNWYEHVNSN